MSDQTAIADFLLAKAVWRAEIANDYPMDPRSRRSAEGLTELAQFVLDLPVDDERVRELATLAVREGMFMPFPEGDRLISRFRFDDPGQESERFLTELAAATRREAVDFAREHGALPDVD